MKDIVNKLFRLRQDIPLPAIPAGERIYAIGDIHGRADLFSGMIEAVERDDEIRGPADTTVILLGDLIDRGPHRAKVVAQARDWSRKRKLRFLSGNHEEMFLQSFFKTGTLRNFMKYGGFETIISYGIDEKELAAASLDESQQMMIDRIPWEDREFLRGFELMIAVGDYLFVHAGIRPKRSLDEQDAHDCRWIREPFLSFSGNLGFTVVHGHTVTDEPVIRHNRIGIDTGAFKSGRLTALRLEETERALIEVQAQDGKIQATARPAISTFDLTER